MERLELKWKGLEGQAESLLQQEEEPNIQKL